jgi:hypothetical protein
MLIERLVTRLITCVPSFWSQIRFIYAIFDVMFLRDGEGKLENIKKFLAEFEDRVSYCTTVTLIFLPSAHTARAVRLVRQDSARSPPNVV